MDDRRDDGSDREGSRREHGNDERHSRRGEDRGGSGGGADTRFLQLEMSQVLYAEAESVTRPAFRELLVEAAKAHLRERFGDKITALAQLAVDELLKDVRSSLDVETRIQERNQDGSRAKERVRDIFAEGGSKQKGRDARAGESPPRSGKR